MYKGNYFCVYWKVFSLRYFKIVRKQMYPLNGNVIIESSIEIFEVVALQLQHNSRVNVPLQNEILLLLHPEVIPENFKLQWTLSHSKLCTHFRNILLRNNRTYCDRICLYLVELRSALRSLCINSQMKTFLKIEILINYSSYLPQNLPKRLKPWPPRIRQYPA